METVIALEDRFQKQKPSIAAGVVANLKDQARDLVSAERAWFTEGEDTVDLNAANAFLP